jgi:hypothetical protein
MLQCQADGRKVLSGAARLGRCDTPGPDTGICELSARALLAGGAHPSLSRRQHSGGEAPSPEYAAEQGRRVTSARHVNRIG